MPIIRRPISEPQKEILESKKKPSSEELQQAQDQLFMYLLNKVAELENQQTP